MDRFRKLLSLCSELARLRWYGPHFCDALACLYVGLWWPLASNESTASEFVVFARRRARELVLELLDCEPLVPSESDSITVSSWGSLLCEQVQRPPWLQQQFSL